MPIDYDPYFLQGKQALLNPTTPIPDLDQSYINEQGAFLSDQEIIRMFAPELRFDKGEKFFPAAIHSFIENSSIANYDNKTVEQQATLNNIGKYQAEHHVHLNEHLDLRTDDFFKGDTPDSNGKIHTESYVEFEKHGNSGILKYNFFYPISAPIPIFEKLYNILPNWLAEKLNNLGTHRGDWEEIDIYINDINGIPVIEKVKFFAHGSTGAKIVPYNQLELVNYNHPVVYVAQNTHASYSSSFYINKLLDFADGQGATWKLWKEDIVNLDSKGSSGNWWQSAMRWGDRNDGPRM